MRKLQNSYRPDLAHEAFDDRDRLRRAAEAASRTAGERLCAYESVLRDALRAASQGQA